MDEGGGYKNAGSKVSRNEQEAMRYWKSRKAFDRDGEGASLDLPSVVGACHCFAIARTEGAEDKYKDKSSDVQGGIICVSRAL